MTKHWIKVLLLMGIASGFTLGLGAASSAREPYPVRGSSCAGLKSGETLSDISVDVTPTRPATIPNAVTTFTEQAFFCLRIRFTGTMHCIAPSGTCTVKPVARSDWTLLGFGNGRGLWGIGTVPAAPHPSAVSMQFLSFRVWSGPGTAPLEDWQLHLEVTAPSGGRVKIDNALMTVELYKP